MRCDITLAQCSLVLDCPPVSRHCGTGKDRVLRVGASMTLLGCLLCELGQGMHVMESSILYRKNGLVENPVCLRDLTCAGKLQSGDTKGRGVSC